MAARYGDDDDVGNVGNNGDVVDTDAVERVGSL